MRAPPITRAEGAPTHIYVCWLVAAATKRVYIYVYLLLSLPYQPSPWPLSCYCTAAAAMTTPVDAWCAAQGVLATVRCLRVTNRSTARKLSAWSISQRSACIIIIIRAAGQELY